MKNQKGQGASSIKAWILREKEEAITVQDFEKAAEYMQQACEGMLTLLGPDHPNTIITQNNLAAVYNKLGEPQKATEMPSAGCIMTANSVAPGKHWAVFFFLLFLS